MFFPAVGDVLIWHAQLLHGGSPIKAADQTRTSLVTHYWTEHDYPAAEDKIVLEEGRYLLKKSHQYIPPTAADINAFLDSLAISPEQRQAVPADFDARGYLLKNVDVFRAGVNPYIHYTTFGHHEGRHW